MKNSFSIILIIVIWAYSNPNFAQANETNSPYDVKLPETPAGKVFRNFIDTYNTGDEDSLKSFADKYYTKKIEDRVNRLLEKYYWYGPANMYSVTINKPYDIEVWLHGKITRTWFAVEFILNEETEKIKATGFLTGEKPSNAPDISVSREKLPGKVSSYLDTLSRSGYFSGAVLIAKDGTPIFEGAYGYANRQSGILNNIDTKFYLASITKIFTGLAIAQLVGEGKISYEDPISKYIPEYPSDISEKVTIHHMLTHTSGIELDHTSEFNNAKTDSKDLEELLKIHLLYINTLKNRNDFEPLKKFDYSNEGYDLAALIVERVSGKSFLEYLEENILIPAGMNNTGFFSPGSPGENTAIGYTNYTGLDRTFKRGQKVPNTIFLHPLFGSSGLYSSAGDLNLLVNAINNNVILPEKQEEKLLTPQIVVFDNGSNSRAYSYGIDLNTIEDIYSIGHNGGAIGGSTELRYYPESGYTVIVLSNFRHSAIIVSNHIRDLLF